MQRDGYLEREDVIVDCISVLSPPSEVVDLLKLAARKRTTWTIHLLRGTLRGLSLGNQLSFANTSWVERFWTTTNTNWAKVRNVPDAGWSLRTASKAHTLLPLVAGLRSTARPTHEQHPPNTRERIIAHSDADDSTTPPPT